MPAWSQQPPSTEPLAGPEYFTVWQLLMPEMPSVPLNVNETGWVYQPSSSGGRDGVAPVIVGGVESYLKEALAVADFPALSVQEPLRVAAEDVGPEYVIGEVHEAMPEKELPPNETETGWLYQPLESGERIIVGVAEGFDVSTLSGKLINCCAPLVHVT